MLLASWVMGGSVVLLPIGICVFMLGVGIGEKWYLPAPLFLEMSSNDLCPFQHML